ncbi:MAG: hydrogen peroxide-inducible genes activator [Bacteroidetes bacterium]|jgi:LysR family hydrogen peroxide-inducible transcriptional activator|nr:hydrogen peroxide-inducible genes activator [Bacteroidota bacterium]HQW46109.1 hydrogen peroxide-inducible genes activator [Chitinophagaceae bacterium]MBK7040441.1 hydrogen peroxide-inducible genes activator [Bacteroidota bacterium]MBK7587218.1 hydrogen peroxide-inducible genes activator [Bacteroidota bacterium]MBK8328256.1 hydrogen peroxide-inducible genes activator [Bacteroidota bacterium]
MTLTQIEYIVAVERNGSFVTAAEKCFVTQPTLSMQIQKLEEELGIKIFDRNHHPILPTDMGKRILEQAKKVLYERNIIDELILSQKDELIGNLNVAIIPTVAPSILPNTLKSLVKKYPKLDITISEMNTENIIKQLKEGELDFGILSTPLYEKSLKETVLYYEPYVIYASKNHKLLNKKNITPEDLDVNEIWSLGDEHCMRFQVINLCGKQKFVGAQNPFTYHSGSILSLINMVDVNGGYTILPELALSIFPEAIMKQVRTFNDPIPVREISLVTNKYFTKNKLSIAFMDSLLSNIPEPMKAKNKKRRILNTN